MFKSVTAIFLAIFFVLGSTLLPLGDFSLMADLPGMYHSYTHVVADEQPDIVDFIGDYLLNGKVLLGHNKHDAQAPASAIQFQHQANHINIVLLRIQLPALKVIETYKKHPVHQVLINTSDYQNELFRPPLA